MWKSGKAQVLKSFDENMLHSWAKAKDLVKNIPDELYYTKTLRQAPKFVVDYVVKNMSVAINPETLELEGKIKVKDKVVEVKEGGELSMGVVFLRYGENVHTVFWGDLTKNILWEVTF